MNAPLVRFWWQADSWREQEQRRAKLDPERELLGPVGYMNPLCRHQATSYDILTCDACVAYTRELLALREGARKSDNA